MIIDYSCVKTWSKYLMLLSSGVLIALGIGRFFSSMAMYDSMQYILNIYFIFLGAILICCELGWERVLKNFEFYRFFFGKALFAVFLGFLTFSKEFWYQIAVSAVFFFDALLFIILGASCLTSESEQDGASVSPPPQGAQGAGRI